MSFHYLFLYSFLILLFLLYFSFYTNINNSWPNFTLSFYFLQVLFRFWEAKKEVRKKEKDQTKGEMTASTSKETVAVPPISDVSQSIATKNNASTCQHCLNLFANKIELFRHLRIHIDLKPIMCKICDTPFSKHDHISNHILIHRDPFRCNICEISFRHNDALVCHTRIYHANQKSFACDLCDESFADNRSLKLHTRIH